MTAPNQPAKSTGAQRLTLEQMRAADAWQRAQGQTKEYGNLAKGLPALIMNSGLLQVMAFLNEKGLKKGSQEHCAVLGGHLRAWVNKRFADVPTDFGPFMKALMSADSRKFQTVTAECLAWLRWLRQMAAAVGER